MSWHLLRQVLTWILSGFLAAVWLSRVAIVWINRKSVADISTPEYDIPLRAPIPPEEVGMGRPDLPRARRVSVIVPARNEAEHIEAALLSLLQLDYPDYEVIAVDDRSDDATGTIMDRLGAQWRERGEASHHRLKVLHIEELPPGWLGKVHAMWQAAQHATGEWLLFTDADVLFRADALRRALFYAD